MVAVNTKTGFITSTLVAVMGQTAYIYGRKTEGHRMLTTGNQLRAARALAGLTQVELAERAKLNPNTIRDMEARGDEMLRSSLGTVRAVQVALEAVGIEFLNGDSPGVRVRPK